MSYYYTRDHEWISVNGTSHDTIATVGITDYAQAQLGDIVFVEAPPKGTKLVKGTECAVVESVKAASDIYAPCSGEVVEANQALEKEPALVNTAPENEGWFFRVTLADSTELEGLMDEAEYKNYVASL
jgi:glycine cleavage system H protein